MREWPDWMDHITPDPELYPVPSWNEPQNPSLRLKLTSVRRAFIGWLIKTYEVPGPADIEEAVKRRFGHSPRRDIQSKDLGAIGAGRVGGRYRLATGFANIPLENELGERMRIDALSVTYSGQHVAIETNRGTASSVAQLIKLCMEDGVAMFKPAVMSISTDGDCYVTLHCPSKKLASEVAMFLSKKVV